MPYQITRKIAVLLIYLPEGEIIFLRIFEEADAVPVRADPYFARLVFTD
jgi:hypothetical protein